MSAACWRICGSVAWRRALASWISFATFGSTLEGADGVLVGALEDDGAVLLDGGVLDGCAARFGAGRPCGALLDEGVPALWLGGVDGVFAPLDGGVLDDVCGWTGVPAGTGWPMTLRNARRAVWP